MADGQTRAWSQDAGVRDAVDVLDADHPRLVATGPSLPSLLVDLVAGVEPRCGDVTLVIVDGRSGSGKTQLADELVALVPRAALVHMDDLYPGWDGLEQGSSRLVREVLAPLAEGSDAAFTAWDWAASAPGPTVPVRPQPVPDGPLRGRRVLVVEGCGSATRSARAYAALSLWLEAPAALRKARALTRDGEAFAPHWDAWAEAEDVLLAQEDIPALVDLVVEVRA